MKSLIRKIPTAGLKTALRTGLSTPSLSQKEASPPTKAISKGAGDRAQQQETLLTGSLFPLN